MSAVILNPDDENNDVKIQFYFGDINVTDIFAYAQSVRIYIEDEKAFILLARQAIFDYKYIDDYKLWELIVEQIKEIPKDKRWEKIDKYFKDKI